MLRTIYYLLVVPNLDMPLESEIAHMYTNDRAAYDAKAKEWTALFAT